jgi:hypothetical protein
MFRKKSLTGLLFGCGLILFGTWVSFKFNISGEKLIIGWIVFWIIFAFLSPYFDDISFFFYNKNDKRNKERIHKLNQDLMEVNIESEKKDILIKNSKKIKFELYDLKNLIKKSGINDDEFWIEFFIKNINAKYSFDLHYFYEFLFNLKSEDSQKKLEDILKSKKILREDLSIKSRMRIYS